MYRARADSVTGRYVIAGGRRLICIGNAAVSPGDLVWTDGRCVYGNHYTGGAPYIPVKKTESGLYIPILLDGGKYFFYTPAKGLQSIGEGDSHTAMINHRNGYVFIDSSDILDAEMDSGGNVYSVKKGSYTWRAATHYEIPNYEIQGYMGAVTVHATMYPDFFNEPEKSYDMGTQSEDEYIECRVGDIYERGKAGEENIPVDILLNGEVIRQIDLKPFIESDMADKAASYADETENYMARSGGATYPSFRSQPESFLRKLSASVVNAKIETSGNYCLVVDAVAEQVFFPWISYENPRYSVTAHNVEKFMDSMGFVIRREHTESLTKMGGMVKSWVWGVARYKKRFKVTPSGAETISSEYTASIGDSSVSGTWLTFYNGVNLYDSIVNVNSVTVGDGLKIEAHVNQVSPHSNGFKGTWNKIVLGAFVYDEITEVKPYYIFGDNVEIISYVCQRAGHTIMYPTAKEGIFTRKMEIEESQVILPIQDGFYYSPGEEGGIIYTPDGLKLAEGAFPIEKNLCACKVSTADYLIGVHGEKLYLCREGVLSEIAAGLDNFRLRNLRNIKNWKNEVKGD